MFFFGRKSQKDLTPKVASRPNLTSISPAPRPELAPSSPELAPSSPELAPSSPRARSELAPSSPRPRPAGGA